MCTISDATLLNRYFMTQFEKETSKLCHCFLSFGFICFNSQIMDIMAKQNIQQIIIISNLCSPFVMTIRRTIRKSYILKKEKKKSNDLVQSYVWSRLQFGCWTCHRCCNTFSFFGELNKTKKDRQQRAGCAGMEVLSTICKQKLSQTVITGKL